MVRERTPPDSGGSVFGLAALLWPAPATVSLRRPGDTARAATETSVVAEYLPLPGPDDPRLLLPRRPRRVAAAALRHQPAAAPRARLRRDVAAAGVAGGLLDVARRSYLEVCAAGPAVDTIETFFARMLDREVLLSVHLGKPRANRKPVVQILPTTGAPLGFAKVGVDPLTNSLVRAETSALRAVAAAGLRLMTVSEVLLSDTWNSLEIVMTSPLPVWERRRPVPAGRLVAAGREVAALGPGSSWSLQEWLGASGLLERVAGLTPGDPAARLQRAVADLVEFDGHVRLDCGSWHGDWTPWNMAAVDDRLLVWDWERFASPAPVGFDALHYSLQHALVTERRPPQQAAAELTEAAPALLAPFGVAADTASVVVLAYLVELACRYLHDGQEAAGARLGRVGDWLLPVLCAKAARR